MFEPSIAFRILLVALSIMPVLSLEKIEACSSSSDEDEVNTWMKLLLVFDFLMSFIQW